MHYQRQRKYGSLEKRGREHLRTDPAVRFWAKVDKGVACWSWKGSTDRNGYGYFRIDRTLVVLAHRFAYEEHIGPVPEGLELDHRCRNRSCVNPAHLEAVTRKKNVQRGFSPSTVTAKTGICGRGHLMTPENVYVTPGDGGRRCRTCMYDRQNRWARAKRAAKRADAEP